MLGKSIPEWKDYFAALRGNGRVASAYVGDRVYWVATEKAAMFSKLFPTAHFDAAPPDFQNNVNKEALSREELLAACVTGWMSHSGPVTAETLSDVLGIASQEIEQALVRLEASGSILRGQFTGASGSETEWCDRRLLARIHRLTLGVLRKEIQPVTAAQFMRWILRWQHVDRKSVV